MANAIHFHWNPFSVALSLSHHFPTRSGRFCSFQSLHSQLIKLLQHIATNVCLYSCMRKTLSFNYVLFILKLLFLLLLLVHSTRIGFSMKNYAMIVQWRCTWLFFLFSLFFFVWVSNFLIKTCQTIEDIFILLDFNYTFFVVFFAPTTHSHKTFITAPRKWWFFVVHLWEMQFASTSL